MERLKVDWIGMIGHLAYRILLESGMENCLRIILRSELSNSNDESDPVQKSPKNLDVLVDESDAIGVEATSSDLDGEGVSSYEELVGTLVRHETERRPSDNLTLCAIAFILLQTSKVTGWFSDLCREDPLDSRSCVEMEKVVFSAFLSHLQMIQCNSFEITEMRPSESADQNQNSLQRHRICCIGVGIYPAMATMNHSCDPTVDLVFYGNKSVIRAIRNIYKSEEVTIDYGNLFFVNGKSQRCQFLRECYFFDCGCRACSEDWPLWDALPSSVLALKCSRCRLPFNEGEAKECPRCRHDIGRQALDTVNRLADSQAKYSEAMQNMADGLEQETVKVVEEHLSTLQDLVCLPWKDFYSCQASLRQLYRIMANRSFEKL